LNNQRHFQQFRSVAMMRVAIILSFCSFVASLRRHSSSEKSGLLFHRRRRTAATYEKLSWKDHFHKYMETITSTSSRDGFNPKCEPYIKEPQGRSRGLILLQHGYTACPGFWYMLTPLLLEQGWTVMAPNLPGHGRNPRIERNGSGFVVTDYSADLPESAGQYEAYAQEVMEIARKYKQSNPDKEMVLNGISHGGAVAVYIAMNGDIAMWDRVMLMNPFLAPPTSLGADYGLSFLRKLLPKALPAFKYFRGDQIAWGEDCDRKRWPNDPRNGGSGGICQFTLKNFKAVLEFGNLVEGEARSRAAKLGVFTGGLVDRAWGVGEALIHNAWALVSGGGNSPPSNLKIQLLTTSNDGSISNARIHFAAAAIGSSTLSGRSGYCALDEEFGHTYINPVDKPVDEDMWWLDEKRIKGGRTAPMFLADFLAEGKLMPVKGTVQDDSALIGDPRCDTEQARR